MKEFYLNLLQGLSVLVIAVVVMLCATGAVYLIACSPTWVSYTIFGISGVGFVYAAGKSIRNS